MCRPLLPAAGASKMVRRFLRQIKDGSSGGRHGGSMPRFFLHIANRIGYARDEEGVELDDLAAAVEQAKDGIRSIISDEARTGRIDLDGRVEIADETGTVRRVIPFPDAVEIVNAADRAYPED